MAKDEGENVSIKEEREHFRGGENAKNERRCGEGGNMREMRKGGMEGGSEGGEGGDDRSAIYSPISSGKKFLHTKGLTFRK